MISANDLLITPIVQTLGRILLHFLWQGLVVALVLWLLFFVFRTSQVRYVLACTALVVMTLLPIFTGIRVTKEQARLEGNRYILESLANATAPTVSETATLEEGVKVVSAPQVQEVNANNTPTQLTSENTSYLQITVNLDRYLPWLVVSWFVGVVALSIRLLGGLFVTQRLRTKLTKAVPREIEEKLESLATHLKLKSVKVVESLSVQVPMVIGWLKPVVLLPTSAISGLSVKQLEMILAHELAHVRRHDYLVNILQTIIETLFFYHPGVWWVSNKIRETREHCCDDLAVNLCGGNKFHYAQTLASLDGLRPSSHLAVAASGGSLVGRIERLAGRTPQTGGVMNWVVSLMLVLIPWLVLSSSYAQAKLPVEIEQNIDTFVEGRLESWNVPGIQVAVIQDGEVTFNKAYGLANIEKNIPMRVDMPIPLGSASWIVNALAAMKLVDQGKLNLDATLETYLPWLELTGKQQSTITVRELIFGDTNPLLSATQLPNGGSLTDREEYVRSQNPGSFWLSRGSYTISVFDDVLLSLVLDNAAGMPLEDYVQTNIFSPLQINAFYGLQMAHHPNIAVTYSPSVEQAFQYSESSKQMNTVALNPSPFLNSVLGLSMSSSDLAKILLSIVNQNPNLLSAESWETFLTAHDGAWAAGGWYWREINNVITLSNVGSTEGSEIFIEVVPEANTAYVTMTNYLLYFSNHPLYQVLGSVSMGLMMLDDNSPFRSIPFKDELLNNPNELTIERIAGGHYESAIGPIEVYTDGSQLKGNILGHEVVFKRGRGLSGFVTQSDYAPLNGLIMDMDSKGISIWYRQFAYRVN
jgi:CubicO group peptidase (beta-lactamase class C family)/beta-lactamase regulating signal transducer with metallopeptidase domain